MFLQASEVHELSALQLSGLSARERNRAKRKAKQMARRTSKDTERRYVYYTVLSRVSTHGRLNINSRLWTTWALTRDQDSIRLYRCCYSASLKCGTWALTQERALARDTTVLYVYVHCILYTGVHTMMYLGVRLD